jgi:hypothetical protein
LWVFVCFAWGLLFVLLGWFGCLLFDVCHIEKITVANSRLAVTGWSLVSLTLKRFCPGGWSVSWSTDLYLFRFQRNCNGNSTVLWKMGRIWENMFRSQSNAFCCVWFRFVPCVEFNADSRNYQSALLSLDKYQDSAQIWTVFWRFYGSTSAKCCPFFYVATCKLRNLWQPFTTFTFRQLPKVLHKFSNLL